ncbi:hypothetical protein [Aquimarina megaterium]|uniref:hypothetical protein n=1 Tax=Aquimarina megaterium TaxID=1443666 RepID=UPI0004B4D140|nr:hypothetical protein [Aquimarina megaterium]
MYFGKAYPELIEGLSRTIENSFFDPKFYSRYTSSYGRSTRIDEFGTPIAVLEKV